MKVSKSSSLIIKLSEVTLNKIWQVIWFNGISTLDGYFMPNPVIYIYIYIMICKQIVRR